MPSLVKYYTLKSKYFHGGVDGNPISYRQGMTAEIKTNCKCGRSYKVTESIISIERNYVKSQGFNMEKKMNLRSDMARFK